MAHTFVNPTVVAKEALMHLENNCVMGNLVYRGFEEEFMKTHNGWKQGQSIRIKTPMYSRIKDGSTIDVVDLKEQYTTFTLGYRKHVARYLTAEELTYSFNKFSERVIQPDILAIAQYIDEVLLGLYKGVCNQIGTPGTTPQSFLPFALAAARLDDHAVPRDGKRHLVIDPTANAYLSDHFKGLVSESKVNTAIEQAKISNNLAGFKVHVSQNVQNHTCGTAAGLTTVLVDDTVAEGDTTIDIDTNGSWTVTLTEGDIFEIDTVYAVNPVAGKKLGYLRQFVCETHTDNGTEATINCTPGTSPYKIYSSSADEKDLPYQTVNELPANNDTVTVAGSASLVHPVNLAFHQNAFGLCMVPLEPLVGMETSSISKNGYTISVTQGGDIINYGNYIRFDVLFGVQVLNPFMACRIAG